MRRLSAAAVFLLLCPAAGRAQPANPPQDTVSSQDAPPQTVPAKRKRKRAPENPGFSGRGIPCPPGTHAVMGKGPHLVTNRTRGKTMQKAVPARRCAPDAAGKAPKADEPAAGAAAAPADGKAAQPGR